MAERVWIWEMRCANGEWARITRMGVTDDEEWAERIAKTWTECTGYEHRAVAYVREEKE